MLALAVVTAKATGLQVFWAVRTTALALKVFLKVVQALTPVAGAEHQQKAIAANMTNKVIAGINPCTQALAQTEQHLIAFGIAVDIDQGISLFMCANMLSIV